MDGGQSAKNLVAYKRTTKSSAFLGADRNSLYEDAHECRAAPQASFIPHHSSAFFIELHPAQSIRQVAWSLGMVAFA